MRLLLALVLPACSGLQEKNEPAPEPPGPAALPELALLAKGPPSAPGPWARAFHELAEAAGVGVVRCPLSGGGKARQRYGTPRDLVDAVGPIVLLEDEDEPPWDPVFDVAVADDEWLSMLAVPGQTRTWIATRLRTLEIEFQPPAPGEVSYCTAIRAVSPRTVRGEVANLPTTEPIFPVACRTGVPPVGADGTFVVDIPPPCTLWVEGGVYRSDEVRVDPGDDPIEVKLTIGNDPLVNPDGTYTTEGQARLRALVADLRARHQRTSALLDEVAAAYVNDPDTTRAVSSWRYDVSQWEVLVGHLARLLEQDARKPPAKRSER